MTYDEAVEHFDYNPRTGAFRRVGGKTLHGAQVSFKGKVYTKSKVIWLMMTCEWPDATIDHIDRNKHNDAWDNYRLCSRAQNAANTLNRNTQSGERLKGAYRTTGGGKPWFSSITIDGTTHYLGRFDTEQEAHEAYVDAATTVWGDFAAY